MIRAIVLASLATGAAAATQAEGLATCQCMGTILWTTHAPGNTKACSWDWAVNDLCTKPTGLASNFTDYPGDYGQSCKKQLEPGHSACFDLSTSPPTEKTISAQADWCATPWCYIDPCNCDASDATKSDYFPGTLFYSYATCGEKNTYTAVESATNTVGNAACATADESSSDANSLTMGLGSLLAVMGTMA
jgi:hypothetical protein